MTETVLVHEWVPNPYKPEMLICQHCGIIQSKKRGDHCVIRQSNAERAVAEPEGSR